MLDFFAKIRFLPVTIFAASLMLTVKLGNIWEGVDTIATSDTITVARAQAQQQPADQGAEAVADSDDGEADGDEDADAVAEDEEDEGDIEDPTLLTQEEIDLLQQLADRREQLDGRERELEERAALLSAAETRISEKIIQLKNYQTTIQGLIQTYDEQQKRKLDALVKVYVNMKPKDAARIFEELDLDTLLMVAEQMKSRKLAPIMAKMNASKAKQVTEELARLREMPGPGGG